MPVCPHRSPPSAERYRYLEGASRRQFAWEWLRRDTDYCLLPPAGRYTTSEGMEIVEPAPVAYLERWGCVFVEDAQLSVPEIPMLWASSLDASVLRVEARVARGNEPGRFNAAIWASNAVVVAGGQGDEHLLLHDERHYIHLHVVAGTLLEGPVTFRFDIGWHDGCDQAVGTLRRFLHLCRSGEWRSQRVLSDRISQRAISTLRVHDALSEGASIRDIGVMLFGHERVNSEWSNPGDSLKSQCRRLISRARLMAGGGYKDLLR